MPYSGSSDRLSLNERLSDDAHIEPDIRIVSVPRGFGRLKEELNARSSPVICPNLAGPGCRCVSGQLSN